MTESEWLALSREQKRVVLAQDVLDLLAARKIVAVRGHWLDLPDLNLLSGTGGMGPGPGADEADLRTTLAEVFASGRNCHVCGLGALFVAHVLREDRCAVGDVRRLCASDILARFESLFDKEEMIQIEIAFETGDGQYQVSAAYGPAGDRRQRARDYGYGFTNSTDRLVAIMTNIVAHGRFDLPEPASTPHP